MKMNTDPQEVIRLGDVTAQVLRKNIRHLYLNVHPPAGEVRISAPHRVDLEVIRLFAVSRLGWIRKQQARQREQLRQPPRDYTERESHYVWGRRCLLTIREKETPPRVHWDMNRLVIYARPGADREKKHALLADWYRREVRRESEQLIRKWQPIMNVRVSRLFIQQMKTRWGSCNTRAASIRLNTELAKKPPACLEYVVVHEMTHLLERSHNERFVRFMDNFLPHWRQIKTTLNSADPGAPAVD